MNATNDRGPALSIRAARPAASSGPRRLRVLNVGSGPPNSRGLHPVFAGDRWSEVRLDIDPSNKPDVISSIDDMRRAIPDASIGAIWSSHAIEHLYAHQVVPAFREFQRVLSPAGFALITCPDLEAIAHLLLEQGPEATAYEAAVGPITPLDMLFGHAPSIASGRTFMAHRTGFTADRLGRLLLQAGFDEAKVARDAKAALWALAMKADTDRHAVQAVLAGTELGFLMEGSPPAE